MMTVLFLRRHEYDIPGYDDETKEKDTGLYSTRKKAEEAILRLRDKPGFRKYPDGFRFSKWPADRDEWEEGFLSMSEMMEDLP
jgi:hypothetical protein